jgi:hypothetical protein
MILQHDPPMGHHCGMGKRMCNGLFPMPGQPVTPRDVSGRSTLNPERYYGQRGVQGPLPAPRVSQCRKHSGAGVSNKRRGISCRVDARNGAQWLCTVALPLIEVR